MERRSLLVVPLTLAAAAGVGFWAMLDRMQEGTFDPRGVPSMLTGKHVPAFNLPSLGDDALYGPGFGSIDMGTGTAVVVNFWASWCAPCAEEHPVLMELKQQGVEVWGIAYKDGVEASRDFLKRRGNPFTRVARDSPGRVAIDWGLTGVPETFIVDAAGIVRWHMAGPLTPEIVARQLLPALRATPTP